MTANTGVQVIRGGQVVVIRAGDTIWCPTGGVALARRRALEVLAFGAAFQDYSERRGDEIKLQGGQVYCT